MPKRHACLFFIGENMATFTLSLTPALRNLGTEGGLDTSVMSGLSKQRTGYVTTVVSGTVYKVNEMNDGQTFTDVPEVLSDLSWIDG